jgi:GTP-binding protein Era
VTTPGSEASPSGSLLKSATVAVIGRPSAGKSTLVNALCGQKVSIVSPVPQTTRNRIRGILTTEKGQIVFIDTPGFHLSEKKFNLHLSDLVSRTLSDVDAALYVVDGARPFGAEEQALLDMLRRAAKPLVICLNKKDRAAEFWSILRDKLLVAFPNAPLVETSATGGQGVSEISDRLFDLAPAGDQMYPEDYYTDQQPDFRIAEIVREKAIAHTRQELPHALYVRMEDLEMRDDGATLWARGFLLVERESQMGILVGKAGEKIRAIVREAEKDLAEIFPYAVKLDMRVKVDREWRKKDQLLKYLIR